MISTLLIILAGIANAYMDKINNWYNSRWLGLSDNHWLTKWARPYNLLQNGLADFNNGAWKNKWKLKDGNIISNNKTIWYYLWLYKPKYKERFIWSSTILVKFTDGWHFFQSLMILFIGFSVYFWEPMVFDGYIADWILNIAGIFGGWYLGFNIFYEIILKRKTI